MIAYPPAPRKVTHQKTPTMLDPTAHFLPLSFACLRVNQLYPKTPLPYQECHKKNTGKEKPPLSIHPTAMMFIISRPPLPIGEFNKSDPYFGILLCCSDLSKTIWAEHVG